MLQIFLVGIGKLCFIKKTGEGECHGILPEFLRRKPRNLIENRIVLQKGFHAAALGPGKGQNPFLILAGHLMAGQNGGQQRLRHGIQRQRGESVLAVSFGQMIEPEKCFVGIGILAAEDFHKRQCSGKQIYGASAVIGRFLPVVGEIIFSMVMV